MRVEFAVHEEHVVTLVLGSFDERVLGIGVGCIQIHHLAVLVGLGVGDGLPVVLLGEELPVGVLEQGELECPLAELLI